MTRPNALLTLIALVSFALLAGPAASYDQYRGSPGCDDCHPGFQGRGPTHDLHDNMQSNCRLCHTSIGDNPELQSSGIPGGQGCRGCHGRDDGSVFGWGAGLRKHHANAGVPADASGLFCIDCHGGDAVNPLPEDTLPVYYSRLDVNVKDPCMVGLPDGEDYNGDMKGLDNDGDLDYDGDDSDCGAVGVGDYLASQDAGLEFVSVSPNPAPNGRTSIVFDVRERGDVVIDVFDLSGRLLVRERREALDSGRHGYVLEGRDRSGAPLASGVYLVRLSTGSAVATKRVVLLQ